MAEGSLIDRCKVIVFVAKTSNLETAMEKLHFKKF